MKKTLKPLTATSLVFTTGLMLATSFTASAASSPLQEKIKSAMAMEHRVAADTKRDDNRDPVRALEFFGLTQDMKVIEFAPGNGWYTKILAPVLREKGELHLAYKKEWLAGMDPLLKVKALNKAKKITD